MESATNQPNTKISPITLNPDPSPTFHPFYIHFYYVL